MPKLNDEAHDILVNRRNDLVNKFKTEFAVVFMGDTHIGMNDGNNQLYYQKVLNRVVVQEKKDKNIIAAFDGGDLADTDNMTLMQTFKSTTESILFKKNSGDKIPLFGNIGNHEYIHNKALALAYNSLIG
ncbi:MAG TPA: hypothetical protein VHR47_01155 [Bacillota bacterium]|nr:hypothetical protein [Bacillota bacterium]